MQKKHNFSIWDIVFFAFCGATLIGGIIYAVMFLKAVWGSDLPLWFKFFLTSGK